MSPAQPTDPGRWSAEPHMARADATYTLFATTFAVVLVLTNIIGTKLFYLFPDGGPSWFNGGEPVTLTAGIVTYPLTFWLTDIVSEVWGHRRANLMVILGFVMSLVMLGVIQLGVSLPPSAYWTLPDGSFDSAEAMQAAYAATFRNPRLLLFASMLAYLVAQLLDVRLYHFWWRLTNGRHLWLRNNGSTILSQLVDTAIVNGIFLRWGLEMEWGTIGHIIVWVYVCKVAMALADTPFIYVGRSALLRLFRIEPEAAPRSAPLARLEAQQFAHRPLDPPQ
ncbi:MAG: queuosine precursor transporter [Planctomycetes bacterium]|nr:queuosine precursor transporter [Planctomycetota bacterium]